MNKNDKVLYIEDIKPEKFITQEGLRLKSTMNGHIKNVADWLDRMAFFNPVDIPNVKDKFLFIECVKTLINLSYDNKNGYMIEFNSTYTKLRKLLYYEQ